jgi:hypothetical protein
MIVYSIWLSLTPTCLKTMRSPGFFGSGGVSGFGGSGVTGFGGSGVTGFGGFAEK